VEVEGRAAVDLDTTHGASHSSVILGMILP
jgi:hypothetical protein